MTGGQAQLPSALSSLQEIVRHDSSHLCKATADSEISTRSEFVRWKRLRAEKLSRHATLIRSRPPCGPWQPRNQNPAQGEVRRAVREPNRPESATPANEAPATAPRSASPTFQTE